MKLASLNSYPSIGELRGICAIRRKGKVRKEGKKR